jgi:hypothetical protein
MKHRTGGIPTENYLSSRIPFNFYATIFRRSLPYRSSELRTGNFLFPDSVSLHICQAWPVLKNSLKEGS